MTFGDHYISLVKQIWSLMEPPLASVEPGESLYGKFRSQYEHVRALSGDNSRFIRTEVLPRLDGRIPLDDAGAAGLELFCTDDKDGVTLEKADRYLAMMIYRRLLAYGREKQDRALVLRQISNLIWIDYQLLTTLSRDSDDEPDALFLLYNRMGQEWLDEMQSWLPIERFVTLSSAEKDNVLFAVRLRCMFVTGSEQDPDTLRRRVEAATHVVALARNQAWREAYPTYDWHRYEMFGLYYTALCSEYAAAGVTQDPVSMALIYDATQELLTRVQDPTEPCTFVDAGEAEQLMVRIRLRMGDIDQEKYVAALLEQYDRRNPLMFDQKGVEDNLLLAVHLIEEIAPFAKSGDAARRKQIVQIYQDIARYTLRMPNNDKQMVFLNYALGIMHTFVELPGGITFADMSERLLANCSTATSIHCQMTGRIAQTLADALIDRAPERFIGLCGCATAQQVIMRRSRILHYVYECGLYHDIGKLDCLDTIEVTYRPVFPEEMDIIRQHTEKGRALLARYPSTEMYAFAAWGHHRWYDGKGGYPEQFRRERVVYPAVLDVLSVADCMDAATDTVFRSYTAGITLETFVQEVQAGAGTRYSPEVAALLTNAALLDKLRALLTHGREEAYQCAYRLYRQQNDLSGVVADAGENKPDTSLNQEDLDGQFKVLLDQLESGGDAYEKLRLLTLSNLSNAKVRLEHIPQYIRIVNGRDDPYGQMIGCAMCFWKDFTEHIQQALDENARGLSLARRVPDYRHTPGWMSLINNAVLGNVILKRHAEAYRYAIQGLQSLNEHPQNPAFYYALLNNTSMILSEAGLYGQARRRLEESMKAVAQMTTHNAIATKYRYAEVLAAQGDYDAAQSLYLELLSGARAGGAVEPWQIIARIVVLAYRRRNGIGLRYWMDELSRALDSASDQGIDETNVLYARAVHDAWSGDYDKADAHFTRLLKEADETLLDKSAILLDAAEFYDSYGRVEKSHPIYIQLHSIHLDAMRLVDQITDADNELAVEEASRQAYDTLFDRMRLTMELTRRLTGCGTYGEMYQQLLNDLPKIVQADALMLLVRAQTTGELSLYPADTAAVTRLTEVYTLLDKYQAITKPVIVSGQDALSALIPPAVLKETGTMILSPMIFRGVNLGFMLIYTMQSTVFDKSSHELVMSLCTGAAIAMNNISRYEVAEHRANVDPLTGIANRSGFFSEVQARLSDPKQLCSLCMIDIDDFKQINDTFGHSIGDQVLKKLSGLLVHLREDGVASRYGGEEFVLLTPLHPGDTPDIIGDAICDAVRRTTFFDGQPHPVTVSVGTCAWHSGQDVMEMLRQADKQLYQAKRTGKDRACSIQ